jgi:hypothetical protein
MSNATGVELSSAAVPNVRVLVLRQSERLVGIPEDEGSVEDLMVGSLEVSAMMIATG